MSERRFGVEIECGHPRKWNHVRQLLARTTGIPRAWSNNVGYDGSGVEVRSPILRGKEGFKQLEEVMNVLVADGGYVTIRDGMHVHHDAPEFLGKRGWPNILRLVDSWVANNTIIDRFVDPVRIDRGCCPKLWTEPRRVDQLKRSPDGGITRHQHNHWSLGDPYIGGRNELNISALREHGTIEFRLHEGTLHFPTAKAWIQFGQYLLDNIVKRKRPLQCANDPAILLKRLRVPKETQERLVDRATNQTPIAQLDPVFQTRS